MNTFEPYKFRNRDYLKAGALKPTPNAEEPAICTLSNEWEIVLPRTESRLVKFYSNDLFQFLVDSFSLSLRVKFTESIDAEMRSPDKKIFLTIDKNAVKSNQEGAYHITVTESFIKITGKSERGTAQGVYHIEDILGLRGEPRLPKEDVEHAPLFSPRMTHPGFELDTCSDEFFSAAAHAGFDAVLIYMVHPDMVLHGLEDPDAYFKGHTCGYCDFNHLVWRAKGYGIDVYLYSKIRCDMHPNDEGAEEYYEKYFGEVFKKSPDVKGIVFVGETFEFPSKDTRTAGVGYRYKPKDDPRPATGYYPCYDYPDLINMVKKKIRTYAPSIDIIFWSYNWGWVDKEARLSLMDNLPKDISYQVTFEMWEYLKDDLGNEYKIADYSIAFPGPCKVFVEEAERAKELGLTLYSMTNTGGRTWDIGSAPYLPVPNQWQKRYENIRKAHALYGLSGLMESHQYGYMPSFLGFFAKNAFTTNGMADQKCLEAIAKRDWGTGYTEALAAWEIFSNGIAQTIPCVADQYGAYRCGPSYPMLFNQDRESLPVFPTPPWASRQGIGIWNPICYDKVFPNIDWSLMRLRHAIEAKRCFELGVEKLRNALKLSQKNTIEQIEQIAVAEYIGCTYTTAVNLMRWEIAKHMLLGIGEEHPSEDVKRLLAALELPLYEKNILVDFMHKVIDEEKENVSHALACQEKDSRIGFEASSEYFFDNKTAVWKNTVNKESLRLLDKYASEN